jgi:hypothetical protein
MAKLLQSGMDLSSDSEEERLLSSLAQEQGARSVGQPEVSVPSGGTSTTGEGKAKKIKISIKRKGGDLSGSKDDLPPPSAKGKGEKKRKCSKSSQSVERSEGDNDGTSAVVPVEAVHPAESACLQLPKRLFHRGSSCHLRLL